MYDELVKRLREPCQYENCILCQQAADAIEELIPFKNQVEKGMGLLDKADELLKAVKPRWIPVTERLPEIEEDVLIAATVHTKKGDVRAVTGDFINTAGQWNGASCSWRYEVTHWMPLPEPPKEENDVQR